MKSFSIHRNTQMRTNTMQFSESLAPLHTTLSTLPKHSFEVKKHKECQIYHIYNLD